MIHFQAFGEALLSKRRTFILLDTNKGSQWSLDSLDDLDAPGQYEVPISSSESCKSLSSIEDEVMCEIPTEQDTVSEDERSSSSSGNIVQNAPKRDSSSPTQEPEAPTSLRTHSRASQSPTSPKSPTSLQPSIERHTPLSSTSSDYGNMETYPNEVSIIIP